MAVITLHKRSGNTGLLSSERIEHDGTVISWVIDNIISGQNFHVYEGHMCRDNEISRNEYRMKKAVDVSVIIMPAGAAAPLIISLIVSVAISILTRQDLPLTNLNRNQQSPNNELSDRRNKARPNQRIVDVVGKVKSIPDVVQREFARYVDNVEERYGYYCFCRNQVLVENIRDGDSLIAETEGSAAGVYYPGNSPNNSTPDIQIGDAINEDVWGVYQSNDALGQTLLANNENITLMNELVYAYPDGHIDSTDSSIDFDEIFASGDTIEMKKFRIYNPALDIDVNFGDLTSIVDTASNNFMSFDTSLDPSWDDIPVLGAPLIITSNPASITKTETVVIGLFNISTVKINKLIANVYAPNGMYRENSGGFREGSSVEFRMDYQKLDDNLDPVGPIIDNYATVTGSNSNEAGTTIEVDLGAATYVKYGFSRVTPKDFDYSGQIVDEIKLKSVFGLFDTGKTDFGNVTTIQTKRSSIAQTTAIKDPEVNAIVTELVYKYDLGVFDTVLTANTQAMQSLIRLALDEYVGRRTADELDLDLLVSTQSECETYFGSLEAGQCSYSFDSTNTSAQEIFFLISNCIFSTLWREGRVLKSWFESPQTIPQMVFTHRSKQPNSETWVRQFQESKRKDSIEFKYTDDELYTQETLYFPENRSGRNPLKVEIPGIKGLAQATWRMMRQYNKLLYQEVSVDFTSTEEGRLLLPKRMISVVKGSIVGSTDGEVVSVNGLEVTLSQDVSFTTGDDHFIILKKRDGTVESIPVTDLGSSRVVQLDYAPVEDIYTGNNELKTEFSFGNEARLSGQLMMPEEISPSSRQYVGIKATNYSDLYYQDDPVQTVIGAFSDGFDDGFG